MIDGFSVSAYCVTLSYDYNAIKSDGIIRLDLQLSWVWESQSSVSLKWAEDRQQALQISVWSFCFLRFCFVEYWEWGVGRSESLHGSSNKTVSRGRAITGDRVVSSNKSLEFSFLNVSLLLEFLGIRLPVRIIFGPSTRQGALQSALAGAGLVFLWILWGPLSHYGHKNPVPVSHGAAAVTRSDTLVPIMQWDEIQTCWWWWW